MVKKNRKSKWLRVLLRGSFSEVDGARGRKTEASGDLTIGRGNSEKDTLLWGSWGQLLLGG